MSMEDKKALKVKCFIQEKKVFYNDYLNKTIERYGSRKYFKILHSHVNVKFNFFKGYLIRNRGKILKEVKLEDH